MADLEKLTKIVEKLPDMILNLGTFYAGYRAFRHPMGGVYSLLGYRLATNTGGASTVPNVSRVLGLAMLGHTGLTSAADLASEYETEKSGVELTGQSSSGGYSYYSPPLPRPDDQGGGGGGTPIFPEEDEIFIVVYKRARPDIDASDLH